MSVRRFDVHELPRAEKLPNGWLRAPATITRTGIFEYRRPDGTVARELRPADEVTRADSLATLKLVPVTNDHPAAPLDASNTKQFAVGSIGDVTVQADGRLATEMLITDAAAVSAVESGEKRDTSCGYTCDIDETPGEFGGQRYDAVQRNIAYNHVAIVRRGRAGNTAVKLDAADAVMVTDPSAGSPREEKTRMKLRIDGVDFDASEGAVQAFARYDAAAQEKLAAAEKAQTGAAAEVDKLTARVDALTEEIKAEKAKGSPEALRIAVAARTKLEQVAAKVLKAGTKIAEMSDGDIKRAIVLAKSPSAKLDGKSDDYVQSRFDHVLEQMGSESPGFAKLREVADGQRADGDTNPVQAAIARYADRAKNAWKGEVK